MKVKELLSALECVHPECDVAVWSETTDTSYDVWVSTLAHGNGKTIPEKDPAIIEICFDSSELERDFQSLKYQLEQIIDHRTGA